MKIIINILMLVFVVGCSHKPDDINGQYTCDNEHLINQYSSHSGTPIEVVRKNIGYSKPTLYVNYPNITWSNSVVKLNGKTNITVETMLVEHVKNTKYILHMKRRGEESRVPMRFDRKNKCLYFGMLKYIKDNQRVEPTVKTSGDLVNEQGTDTAHP
ncbi:hypothetical protein P4E94_19390 [Pontiellaceae bacterium B12219]|nr:hypothetical protein [Pontiellaceae bacterium B12219]